MTFANKVDLNKSPIAKKLIDNHVASRMHEHDGSLFDFSEEVKKLASTRLGWTTLASKPPLNPALIAAIAQQARCEELEAVVLIGQGGSTQASQTITKLHSLEVTDEVPFKTMDSLSPVYVSHILGSSDPAKTLYIVSSKSGSTFEPTVISHVVWSYVCAHLGQECAGKRFIAITDAGSHLESVARKNGWRAVLHGQEDVGGRYSALSVFGLLPMACVGIDVEEALKNAIEMESLCASDSLDNPALQLATFLYKNYCDGRDKFSLLLPSRTQVFGLWVEQLVAESLGKQGVGIVPNVEVDPGILADPHEDRCAILCNMGNDQAFEHARTCLHPDIPAFRLDILDSADMMDYFLIWEYAIAFCGWLMQINPFDQPDVESTKIATKKLLYGGASNYDIPLDSNGVPAYKELALSENSLVADKLCASCVLLPNDEDISEASLNEALRALFNSIEPGDYFSLNAFLPFRGTGRREALERIRHRVADRLSTCSCLEIGPRYLHSTGQLHKGGKDTGVFLLVSSNEQYDIGVPHENFTLGQVSQAEAFGDFSALASRGRRVIYVNLLDNSSKTLALFADAVCNAISAAYARRRHLTYNTTDKQES